MDNKIIKSIQNQNDKAFEYIDKEYGQLIHYILYNLRLSHQDVEECYNDILLKLWTHLQSYDVRQASLKNYIALITRRTGLIMLEKINVYMKKSYMSVWIFLKVKLKGRR